MARDDYVLEAFIRALRRGFSGFGRFPKEVQQRLASLIWDCDSWRREHSKYAGYYSINYQELYAKFGRKGFRELNERFGFFEIREHWSREKRYTKAYKLTSKTQEIKDRFLRGNIRRLDNLIGGDGRYIRTPPKAVASKDMDGITASSWKYPKFESCIPVDISSIKELEKYLKDVRKRITSGLWNRDLFFTHESIEDIDYCLEYIAKLLRMANTVPAGREHVIHRYIESRAGRLYAKNINLQTAPRAIKEAALHGLWEYDFINCHYAIFHHLAGLAGIYCKNIQHYLENTEAVRFQIAREVEIPRDEAKVCLIAIMYGARESLWHESAIPQTVGDKAEKLYRHPLYAGLMSDIRVGRKAILEWWPDTGRTTYMNAMSKRIKKKESPEKILAHLIQGIETKMLNIVLYLHSKHILLLQHDGFASSKQLDKDKIIREIRRLTGIEMRLKEAQIQVSEELIFSKT